MKPKSKRGGGSKKVEKKIVGAWTENEMQEAIDKYNSGGCSKRTIAKELGISESTLRFRLKKISEGKELGGQGGRPRVLSDKEEEELAKCIGVLCNVGFSPSYDEILVSILIDS